MTEWPTCTVLDGLGLEPRPCGNRAVATLSLFDDGVDVARTLSAGTTSTMPGVAALAGQGHRWSRVGALESTWAG